jgi:hypothetical protein
MKEPTLKIPRKIDRERGMLDFQPGEFTVFIPIPNTQDKGFYVDRQGLAILLRANKNNPDAIQYLADMLE